jgi:hypothetical protein
MKESGRLPNGLIEPSKDSKIGFTPDIFEGCLFKRGNEVWIARIHIFPFKQGMKHFSRLLEGLSEYSIRVACPSFYMRQILTRKGFLLTEERCLKESCPVMVSPPSAYIF